MKEETDGMKREGGREGLDEKDGATARRKWDRGEERTEGNETKDGGHDDDTWRSIFVIRTGIEIKKGERKKWGRYKGEKDMM